MADDLISEERWQAGADYLDSLRSLGLEPEAVLWAQHDHRKELMLFIISSIVDRVGSTEIYDTLFKAFDHAVTPQNIDPWIVSVVSPMAVISREFHEMLHADVAAPKLNGFEMNGELFFGVAEGDYNFRKSWVYFASSPRRIESKHQLRTWRAFQHNVDRAAA